ncbi:lactate utilization protein C [Kitasatospora sp. NPDC059571]|uniref:LutC/YkgG family protein n=1 Tax=Kitasatospora sp. NPDC059571 TaxID=3346871 RepID=UPI0036747D48
MSAREEVLRRIREALGDVPAGERPQDVAVPRGYAPSHAQGVPADLFAGRVADYRATVVRCGPDGVASAVHRLLADRGVHRAAVAPGLPAEWLPPGDLVVDEPPLSTAELDGTSAVVTTAALGIAVTGTLVLDGGAGQGRRALTLLPDHHVCILPEESVVGDLPEALARLDPARPLTFVSGPSATSDIELDRVEGVHGPRVLDVVLVAPRGTP